MSESTLAPINIKHLDLELLNQKFEKANPKRILAWCASNLPTGLVQVSSFNIDDLVITDLLYREFRNIEAVPVIFVDSLHHFPETLSLVATARAIYNLNLKIYRIANIKSCQAFAAKYGQELWKKDLDKFNQLTKVKPLETGLRELNALAWITADCRHQSSNCDNLVVFERDKQGRLKINPLAYWTRTESWAYAYEHDLIYNPLHDRGYTMIGDEPLTTKVKEGEGEKDMGYHGEYQIYP